MYQRACGICRVLYAQVQFHDIGLSFERPPITIASVLIRDDEGSISNYRENLTLGFPLYTLIAVGDDEVSFLAPIQNYKSVFTLAKLDGPFVEVGL